MVSARTKSVPTKPELEKRKSEYQQLYGSATYDFSQYAYTISKIEYDCAATRFRHLSITFYDTRGEPILGIYDQKDWYDVPAHTISEKVFKAVCVNAKQP